jgi:hypothetical protein
MQPVQWVRKHGARAMKVLDRGGGVFLGLPKLGVVAPVYAFPEGAKTQEPIFTCPVSAIPPAAWRLYGLWIECRGLGALPYAGGVLDQPLIVRRAFPIFDAEARAAEVTRGAHASAAGSAAGTAAVLAAAFGGKKR